MTRVVLRLVLAGAVAVLGQTVATAQNLTIVLKVERSKGALGDPKDGQVTITLLSGTRITVPLSDIDLELTKSTTAQSMGDKPAAAADASAQINTHCATMFPSNFTMQASCRKQEQQAQQKLTARTMASGDRATIRTQCNKMFPDNFMMRNSCEEQELKALAELGK